MPADKPMPTTNGDDDSDMTVYLSPAAGWDLEPGDPIYWEMHYWARTYDRDKYEFNASVIEQLGKLARSEHEQTVGDWSAVNGNLKRLDRLQSHMLRGEPFGHRCSRAWEVSEREHAEADAKYNEAEASKLLQSLSVDKGGGPSKLAELATPLAVPPPTLVVPDMLVIPVVPVVAAAAS